ncbi:hypothetical protein H5410_045742 [Solanum commersonii]|uniref:L-gulonolactone oxidase 2-like C-terminal domain-containing protein n=1 Tax=Solanum commersonii TaxID=4109 RepID=A0A9J5XDM3_SOLCO|nr:hypothetical protein H5410_045742 [Solanum commersonii]
MQQSKHHLGTMELKPKALCVLDLYSGILMRYVTPSNAYLCKQENNLDFDITYYRIKDPMSPRLFEDFLEVGKNRNVEFIGAINKYKNLDKFFKVNQSYDQLGLFSSEWKIIFYAKRWVDYSQEGCALEGLCICSEDIICAPKKGLFCRPEEFIKMSGCVLFYCHM